MRGFKEFVDGFESDLKGETIGNSELIRQIHNSFSSPNPFFDDDRKSAQRSHDDDGLFHFVGYLRFQNKIYELDGLKQAPILHDADCPSDDAFMAKLPEILQRRISKYQATELRFSLLAIIKDKLEILKEFGADEHMIAQELEKRHQWHKENDLRKKDFVGLLCDVVKGIGAQASEAEWAQILANGRVRGTERSRIQRARKFDI
ncbi:hypothetical protein BABINDRAFT_160802 [Babjeviella inositovora NRRL Y-12698]|uniref:ubiquitinyl hydrolase 1 n=1 Tax=Babjeviella inositovora NRRL Y-12698 TaxID=984486 RepID=A0A1E3QS88_9ASCO|nr:uncharacterized protein BABINDRAFT_160802 [Babjeviella inositovora NRRL Y-12698]ODQ80530.1 hypothetical protein BABINDRAFT_160802 [Babjeviella inositovora NRRL Y-12698]